jgi:hypothetical protein
MRPNCPRTIKLIVRAERFPTRLAFPSAQASVAGLDGAVPA